jgi:hypothetical protein
MARQAAHKKLQSISVLIVPKGIAGWAKPAEDQTSTLNNGPRCLIADFLYGRNNAQ